VGSARAAGAAREDAVAAADGALAHDRVAVVVVDLGGDDAGDVGVHVKLLRGG
jgi:hypothetical protein